MHILGITGGIATGKSTVTRMLADLGAPTVSADTLARELLAPGTVTTRAVLQTFPDCADPADATGQTLDRRALGQIVFADSVSRHRLESLMHPAIIGALQSQIAAWHLSDRSPVGAAEIPLLFEAGLVSLVDMVVVVTCAEPLQISRLHSRLGIDETEARRLIAAQWPLADKIAQADILITTDRDLTETRQQVETLWAWLTA